MKIKILFFLLILTVFYINGNAQDSLKTNNQNYNFGIGAGAGSTTGNGISFRYTPTKFGMQLNFAPFKDEYTESYSLGLSFLYKISEGKNINLFLYQANHYYYKSSMEYNYDPYIPFPQLQKQTTEYMNNGVGIGLEAIFLKRMSFNIMAGYAFFRNFKEINLTAETALYYNF